MIAPDRIITAAHVVEGLAERPHAIELFFGEGVERLTPSESPTVLWSGRQQGCNRRIDVDVAVLQCALPEGLLPKRVSLAEGKCGPLTFFGCGYSGAGKVEKENGQYDFSGTFPMVTGIRIRPRSMPSTDRGPTMTTMRRRPGGECQERACLSEMVSSESQGLRRRTFAITNYRVSAWFQCRFYCGILDSALQFSLEKPVMWTA
jgi:hypothetical protein